MRLRDLPRSRLGPGIPEGYGGRLHAAPLVRFHGAGGGARGMARADPRDRGGFGKAGDRHGMLLGRGYGRGARGARGSGAAALCGAGGRVPGARPVSFAGGGSPPGGRRESRHVHAVPSEGRQHPAVSRGVQPVLNPKEGKDRDVSDRNA